VQCIYYWSDSGYWLESLSHGRWRQDRGPFEGLVMTSRPRISLSLSIESETTIKSPKSGGSTTLALIILIHVVGVLLSVHRLRPSLYKGKLPLTSQVYLIQLKSGLSPRNSERINPPPNNYFRGHYSGKESRKSMFLVLSQWRKYVGLINQLINYWDLNKLCCPQNSS